MYVVVHVHRGTVLLFVIRISTDFLLVSSCVESMIFLWVDFLCSHAWLRQSAPSTEPLGETGVVGSVMLLMPRGPRFAVAG